MLENFGSNVRRSTRVSNAVASTKKNRKKVIFDSESSSENSSSGDETEKEKKEKRDKGSSDTNEVFERTPLKENKNVQPTPVSNRSIRKSSRR